MTNEENFFIRFLPLRAKRRAIQRKKYLQLKEKMLCTLDIMVMQKWIVL